MADIWVPPAQRREDLMARARMDAEVREQVDAELRRTVLHVHALVERLQTVDPYLDIVYAGEKADDFRLVPGRWHLVRHNPDAPDTYDAIVGPNGEYREPGSGVYDMLLTGDMWNARARRDWERGRLEAEREKERNEERRREETREEIADRIKAKLNPGVSFTSQGTGWRYRANARYSPRRRG